mgnify:CR=1 FL=1
MPPLMSRTKTTSAALTVKVGLALVWGLAALGGLLPRQPQLHAVVHAHLTVRNWRGDTAG